MGKVLRSCWVVGAQFSSCRGAVLMRACVRQSVNKGRVCERRPKFNYPKAIKLTRNQNNKTAAPEWMDFQIERWKKRELLERNALRMTCELTLWQYTERA